MREKALQIAGDIMPCFAEDNALKVEALLAEVEVTAK